MQFLLSKTARNLPKGLVIYITPMLKNLLLTIFIIFIYLSSHLIDLNKKWMTAITNNNKSHMTDLEAAIIDLDLLI